MKIKIYHHVNDMPGWIPVINDQLNKIQLSGLLDASTEYHLCCNGEANSFGDVKAFENQYPGKIFAHHTAPDPGLWEWPTLHYMWRDAQKDESDYYIVYLHLKGLSTGDLNKTNWRLLMDYWIVERWKDCVALLDRGYDTVGVNHTEDKPDQNWPPTYSGNFWWAKSSHIRRLDPLPFPPDVCLGEELHYSPFHKKIYDGGNFRYDHEFWVLSKNPRWAEVYGDGGKYDYNVDWYASLNPSDYRDKPAQTKQWDDKE